MRLILAVSIGFGLLALTACSKTQQPPVANNVSSPDESASHATSSVHATDGKHNHVGATHGHQPSSEHGSHGDAHVDHHASANKHDEKQSGHGSRQHGHGSHEHSPEHHDGHESNHIAVGDKVPDFEVTIAGETAKLSDLQKNMSITEDGTLVLTFWCSFCHSCRDVEHDLNELAEQYKGKAGVIALNASAGETADKVSAFASENDLTLPIVLNADGTAAEIFGTRVTTTTVVIDSDGVLRYCGQFGDDQHAFAADALKAVLAGEEVHVKKTRHKG